ncbi:PTS transporter subunit EIIC [Microbacterium dextranolyticum]|uniref:Uncharacterized protein n=2 Tax=Microbacterium dextranolyticum TaxID=36806 RepID=A0A9W6HMF1_9MICO|nr:PTS transporter subunit EIIC [Microbacterium dextranolyticum]GLJ95203.1 hypothetical protein GCM10017591_12650 [Microbacterium dextranolyticum]
MRRDSACRRRRIATLRATKEVAIDDVAASVTGILHALGGPGNIRSLGHCATRLRIVVADPSRVDQGALMTLPSVLGAAQVASQVQIVVGPASVDAFDRELRARLDGGDEPIGAPTDAMPPRASPWHPRRWLHPVSVLMDIVTPLLPSLVAAGLLLAVHNLLSAPGVFGSVPAMLAVPWLQGVAAVVGALGAGVFALLPVLVGFTAAARFGANPHLGAALGAALVAAPFLAGAPAGAGPGLGGGWIIAGVDVLAIDYRGTVLPVIAAAYVLARVERLWMRAVRGAARFLLVPMLTLLVAGTLAFVVIGPVMVWLGDAFADLIDAAYTAAGVLGGALFGALYPFLVMTGTHQGLVSLELGLLADGGSFIFPIAGAANLAQAGACFGVMVLARRAPRLRSFAAGAGLPAMFGIAEPAIFGITLRLRFPLVAAVIGSAAGGALLAAWHVQAVTLGAAGLAGVASIAPGSGALYLAGAGVSAALAFVLTVIWGYLGPRGRADLAAFEVPPSARSSGARPGAADTLGP